MTQSRTPVSLAISGLATYRATRLITTDTIAAPLRDRVWAKYPPHKSRLGYLLTCDWCTSHQPLRSRVSLHLS